RPASTGTRRRSLRPVDAARWRVSQLRRMGYGVAHMHPPMLETERLTLAVPTEKDARELFNYALRTESYHAPWSPPKAPQWNTLKSAYERAQQYQDECEQGHTLRLWFRAKTSPLGPFIGAATLSQIQLGPRRACFLGYHLDQPYEGKGYMHEALTRIID